MSQILLFVLLYMLGLAAARTNINCSLEFDDSLSMQQQLQGQEVVVPFQIDPPFAYQLEDGRFAGLSYDVLQEIAIRGNFSASVISGGQVGENETSDKVLLEMLATSDFVGGYWPDTPSLRAQRVMISLHYVDVTRYLVTLPDVEQEANILSDLWKFSKPFTFQLWIVILFGILFSGAVTYALELSPLCGRRNALIQQKQNETEPNAKRWTVYWGFLHRSLAHFTMAGDSIEAKSVMGQVHNVVWAFVVMVLLAAYTANLAGTLVVKKTQYIDYSTLLAINQAGQSLCISADDRAYVFGDLKEFAHNETRPSGIELAEALLAGHCVGAIMTESAYQILRTDITFCNLTKRTQIGPNLGGGFAFPIDRCGTYYLAVINSILSGMRADRSLDALWAKHVKQVNCPAKPAPVVVSKAQGMRLEDFSGLFILYLIWIGVTVGLRIFEQTYSGMHIAAKKVKARVSKHNASSTEDPDPSNSAATATPRYSTTSNQSETEEFGNDLDSLDAKVAGVEFTMSHIIATLRDLNIPVSPQTHKRMLSKQTTPQSTNKRLSNHSVPTFISNEEKKSDEHTGRLSQNKTNDTTIPVSEPVKSSALTPEPGTAQTPEPAKVQTPEPNQPEPPIAQAPEPTIAQAPEPTITQASEPTIAQAPEPTIAQTPEPTIAQTPQPTAAQTPEPTAAQTPEPTTVQTSEPLTVQTSEPITVQTSEPITAQTPEPTIVQTPEPTNESFSVAPEKVAEPLNTSGPEQVPELSKRSSQIAAPVAEQNAELTAASFAPSMSPVLDEKSASKVETSTKGMNLPPLDVPQQSELPKGPGRLSTAVFVPFGPPSPRLQETAERTSVGEKVEPATESPRSSASTALSEPASGAIAAVDVQQASANEPSLGGLNPIQELDDPIGTSSLSETPTKPAE